MRFPKVLFYPGVAAFLLTACSGGGAPPSLPPQNISTGPSAPNALAANPFVQYATPKYKAVQLPAGFVPYAIMKDGQIPGSSGKKAAIYHNGTLKILGQYNGEQTVATSVNTSGVAVGFTSANTPTASRAVKYANGAFSAFPYVTNCKDAGEAQTINDAGEVYGLCWEQGEDDSPQMARYAPGTPSLISGPFSGRGAMYNVNDSGRFVYSGYFFATDVFEASKGNGTTAVAVLPAKYVNSMATWINDAGTIVGSLSMQSGPPWTPFNAYVYPAGGPLKILPLLTGATQMTPAGINKNGTVVGNWDNGLFLYKSGVLYNITNSIMPAGTYSAYPGLADSGDFVASSTNGLCYIIEPAGP